MLVEKQYAKAGTHHPSFSISIRQCLITQKKKKRPPFFAQTITLPPHAFLISNGIDSITLSEERGSKRAGNKKGEGKAKKNSSVS